MVTSQRDLLKSGIQMEADYDFLCCIGFYRSYLKSTYDTSGGFWQNVVIVMPTFTILVALWYCKGVEHFAMSKSNKKNLDMHLIKLYIICLVCHEAHFLNCIFRAHKGLLVMLVLLGMMEMM